MIYYLFAPTLLKRGNFLPTQLERPEHKPVEIDGKAYDLAKTLPILLHQLVRGAYEEIRLTTKEIDGEQFIILDAASHKTCEEQGCQEKCWVTIHDNSVQIPFRQLDEILDEMFHERHRKYPADSPLPK